MKKIISILLILFIFLALYVSGADRVKSSPFDLSGVKVERYLRTGKLNPGTKTY